MTIIAEKLDRDFYLRPTLDVACDMIGKYIVYKSGKHVLSARLVEVEAYIGKGDPACHAATGQTARNEVMFDNGGFSYIYFIYGMYHCFNVVTEKEGFPAAVLIRAAEPDEGLEMMKRNYKKNSGNLLTNGPGKLCKAFNLTRDQNGLDLTGEMLYLEDRNYKTSQVENSKRIGIKKGIDKEWRFFDPSSLFISVRQK